MATAIDDPIAEYHYEIDQFYLELLKETKQIERIQQSIAIISFTFCISVLFICCYKWTNLVRGKPFVKIVLTIALCDALASLGFAFGYPKGDLCTAQSVIIFFFERLSWIYTAILVFQLYKLVVYRTIIKSKLLHVAAISINIVLQLLPFTTTTYYGSPTQVQGLTNCLMHSGSSTTQSNQIAYNWLLFLNSYCYFVVMFTILVLYMLIFLKDFYPDGFFTKLLKMKAPIINKQQSSPIMNDAKITMTLYVTAMIVSWTSNNAYGTVSVHTVDEQTISLTYLENQKTLLLTNDKFDCLCPTYGFLLALIFYSRTKQARIEWINIFKSILIALNILKQDDQNKNLLEEGTRTSELTNRQICNIEDADDDDDDCSITSVT